jgi:hypothetical protein
VRACVRLYVCSYIHEKNPCQNLSGGISVRDVSWISVMDQRRDGCDSRDGQDGTVGVRSP